MKNYEDEEFCLGGDILFGILMIVSIYVLFGTFSQYYNGDFGLSILVMMALVFGIFIIISGSIVFINIINVLYNRKVAKTFKANGTKVKGIVVSITKSNENKFRKTIFRRATYIRKFPVARENLKSKELYYYANVKYTYKNKEYTIKTPSLTFLDTYLEKKDVDVYVYNNKAYVDNFKIDSIEKVKDEIRYLKTIIYIIGLFIASILLTTIVLYLNYLNIIGRNITFILFILFMIIYFVLISIRYYKYVFKK